MYIYTVPESLAAQGRVMCCRQTKYINPKPQTPNLNPKPYILNLERARVQHKCDVLPADQVPKPHTLNQT